MKRRDFFGCLAAACLGRASSGIAQPSKPPLIGLVFTPGNRERMLGPNPSSPPARAFIATLSELGWSDGRSVSIERLVAVTDADGLARIFRQLEGQGSKVNVLAGARWIQDAALRTTPSIPIVTLFHEDPVAAGLISSLARPGGNITGVTSTTGPEVDGKRAQIVSELLGGRPRLAFLAPSNQIEQLRLISGASGIVAIPVDVADQYEGAFAAIVNSTPDALVVSGGPLNYVNSKRIAAFCSKRKLPAIFAAREGADEGGLMSYGPSIPGAFRQMAAMVDRILRGAKAEDIPVEQPTRFELVINLATAKAFGVSVPPTLLALAEDIIE